MTLLRAARLARAPLPDDRKDFKEIAKAQQQVSTELTKVSALVVDPATVQTRLVPRLQQLEAVYVPAYLEELMALDAAQRELDDAVGSIAGSNELTVLRGFPDSAEAKHAIAGAEALTRGLPPRLRKAPEDRDTAARDVRDLACVPDSVEGSPLSLRRLVAEVNTRTEAAKRFGGAATAALEVFAVFLMSPRIAEGLTKHQSESALAGSIVSAKDTAEVRETLLAATDSEIAALAKVLKAVSAGKVLKAVKISHFKPKAELVWDKPDIAAVVDEFRLFLEGEWEDGRYLKVEQDFGK